MLRIVRLTALRVVVVVAATLPGVASAGDDYIPYRPTTSGPFVTFTAPITARGRLLTQPILSTPFTRGAFDAAGRLVPFAPGEAARSGALTVFAELGLPDELAVGAQLTLAVNHRRLGERQATVWGPGDALLFFRHVLTGETAAGLPETTLLLQLKAPTGNAHPAPVSLGADVLGTGSTDLTLGLDLTRGLRPVLLHVDLLLTHPVPTSIGGRDVAWGDSLGWSLSVEWPLLPDRLGLMAEVSGRHQLSPVVAGVRVADGHLDELVFGGGVELLFSANVQLLVGYQRTVWGRNTPATDTAVVTLVPLL